MVPAQKRPARHGFALLDLTSGRIEVLAVVEAHLPANRMNDGKCDRTARASLPPSAGTAAPTGSPISMARSRPVLGSKRWTRPALMSTQESRSSSGSQHGPSASSAPASSTSSTCVMGARLAA